MTSNTKTGQKPTHELLAEENGAEGQKAFWTKIGAAWPHKDAEGAERVIGHFVTCSP
jgi:hypothetical protein